MGYTFNTSQYLDLEHEGFSHCVSQYLGSLKYSKVKGIAPVDRFDLHPLAPDQLPSQCPSLGWAMHAIRQICKSSIKPHLI